MLQKTFLVFFLFLSQALIPFEGLSAEFSEVYKEFTKVVDAGNFSKAEPLALEAYKLGVEKFGGKSPEVGTLSYNVGFVFNNLKRFEEALPYLNRSLEILKEINGENSLALLDVYMELGKAELGVDNDRTAKKYFERGLEVASAEYGPNHEILIDLNLEAGNQFFGMYKTGAKGFYDQAYQIGSITFPEGNFKTGVAAFNIGKIYDSQNLRKKAEEYYLEALSIYQKDPPPDDRFLMIAHAFLVAFYSRKGKDEEATFHCVQVGKIRGDEDIDTAQALYKVRPIYPKDAMFDGREGKVRLEFTVGEDGKVYNPRVLETSGNSFSLSAIETIQKWRYAPRVVDGEPVSTDGLQFVVYYSFKDD